jgi:hypothetical protein
MTSKELSPRRTIADQLPWIDLSYPTSQYPVLGDQLSLSRIKAV